MRLRLFRDDKGTNRRMRVWMILAAVPGLLFNAWSIYWLADRGYDAYLVGTNRVKEG